MVTKCLESMVNPALLPPAGLGSDGLKSIKVHVCKNKVTHTEAHSEFRMACKET